jgi:hypothetical protein
MPTDHPREFRMLTAPEHLCNDSAELLTFVQLAEYTEAFINFALTDDEQRAVETGIMMNPTLAPIIDGTGGVREFEFCMPNPTPRALHLSAYYAYFPEDRKVALISLLNSEEFSTDELDPDSRKELKRIFEGIQKFGPEAWE